MLRLLLAKSHIADETGCAMVFLLPWCVTFHYLMWLFCIAAVTWGCCDMLWLFPAWRDLNMVLVAYGFVFLRQKYLPAVCSDELYPLLSIQQRRKRETGRWTNIHMNQQGSSTINRNGFVCIGLCHICWVCWNCRVCPVAWGRDVVAAALALLFAAPQARADVGEGVVRICALNPWHLTTTGDMLPPGAKQEDRIRKGLEACNILQQLSAPLCGQGCCSVIFLSFFDDFDVITRLGTNCLRNWHLKTKTRTLKRSCKIRGFSRRKLQTKVSRQEKIPWDFVAFMTQEWDDAIGFLRPAVPIRQTFNIHSKYFQISINIHQYPFQIILKFLVGLWHALRRIYGLNEDMKYLTRGHCNGVNWSTGDLQTYCNLSKQETRHHVEGLTRAWTHQPWIFEGLKGAKKQEAWRPAALALLNFDSSLIRQISYIVTSDKCFWKVGVSQHQVDFQEVKPGFHSLLLHHGTSKHPCFHESQPLG